MSVPLLDIPLRPSRFFAFGLCFLYGLSGAVLVLAPLDILLRLVLLGGLVVLSWHAWREWKLLASIGRLQVLPQSYRLITTAQEEWDLTGGHQTLVTRGLVILHLHRPGRTVRLPLFQDAAAAEDLRRLRVWLRCRV